MKQVHNQIYGDILGRGHRQVSTQVSSYVWNQVIRETLAKNQAYQHIYGQVTIVLIENISFINGIF
jgi:hypothetical protein